MVYIRGKGFLYNLSDVQNSQNLVNIKHTCTLNP